MWKISLIFEKKRMRYLIFFLFIGSFALYSCNSAKNPKKAMKDLQFLNGTWINEEEGVILKESWKIVDGNMVGYSLLALPKDTLYFENITIFPENGVVTYKSSVGKYVIEETKRLPLTRSNGHTALFGNRNILTTPYIFYQKRGNRLILEVRDIIDNKIEQDRYFLKPIE